MEHHIYPRDTKHTEIEHYDLLILGAGPAGLTAAIYAGRYNLKTAVIAKSFGGTANLAGEIHNWPGFMGAGMELTQKFKTQAEHFGAKMIPAEVDKVEKDDNGFVFYTKEKVIHGRALIIALGTEHRKLNIDGEKEFLGKGVSYCATCDGMFFKNKTVAVVGGADSAAKAALYLSGIAKQVYIIYRKSEMRCEPISLQKIEETPNIKIYYNSTPEKINGEKFVKSLDINHSKSMLEKDEIDIKLDVDGVFIEIGATPTNEIIKDLDLNSTKDGYIVTDKEAKTSKKGIFAAGDVTNNLLKQVVTAASEGAIAAKSAYDYLKYEYSREIFKTDMKKELQEKFPKKQLKKSAE